MRWTIILGIETSFGVALDMFQWGVIKYDSLYVQIHTLCSSMFILFRIM